MQRGPLGSQLYPVNRGNTNVTSSRRGMPVPSSRKTQPWQGAGAVSTQCFGECLCLWRCCSEQASAGSVLTSFSAFWGIFTQTQQNDFLKKKSEREIKKLQLLWHMLKIPKSFGLKCAKRKKI